MYIDLRRSQENAFVTMYAYGALSGIVHAAIAAMGFALLDAHVLAASASCLALLSVCAFHLARYAIEPVIVSHRGLELLDGELVPWDHLSPPVRWLFPRSCIWFTHPRLLLVVCESASQAESVERLRAPIEQPTIATAYRGAMR